MKYSIWPISPSFPDQPYLAYMFSSEVYGCTDDLESAIFIGKHLLSHTVYRVHIVETFTNKYAAIILREGNVTSPEILVRL
jgi:hypothetical protein